MASSQDRATFVAGAIVIGAAVLVGLTVLPRISPSRASSDEGERKPAPEFSLPVATKGDPGSRLALADMKGSPVLLDFWATWCGPCSLQSPIVDRIARRYEEKGLHVVGINVIDDDHAAAAAHGKSFAYPIVIDETGLTQKAYGVDRLPTLVLIDKEGRVVKQTHGLVDESSLDKMVRDIL